MAINKVVYGDVPIIDLTDSTFDDGADLLTGVSAYDNGGNLVNGSMADNGTVTETLDTTTTSYTIPEGYHSGSGTVGITTQTKTATPSTSSQNITPDAGKVLSKVTVSGITTQTKTVSPSTSSQDVTPDTGKYLSKVTVNAISTQTKTVTASRSNQTVTPDSGKYLSSVTVNKFPDATGTFNATTRGSAVDMTATNNYRYVNTNGVPSVSPTLGTGWARSRSGSNPTSISTTLPSAGTYLFLFVSGNDGTLPTINTFTSASGTLSNAITLTVTGGVYYYARLIIGGTSGSAVSATLSSSNYGWRAYALIKFA